MRKILLLIGLFLLLTGDAFAAGGVSVPTSGSGSVSARNRGSICASNCIASNVGGSFVWFDVRNLSHDQFHWDSLIGNELAAARPKLSNGSYGAVVEKQLSQLAATRGCGAINESGGEFFGKAASSDCVLWENYCARSSTSRGANSVVYTQPFQAARKIKACGQTTSNFTQWNEMHTFTYEGGIPTINTLTGWNVALWREGSSSPIFERRIGLTSQSEPSDADPFGLSQQQWWFGGVSSANRNGGATGGVFSADTRYAGLLGGMPSTGSGALDAQDCQSRWANRSQSLRISGSTWKNSAAAGPSALYRRISGQWVSTTPGYQVCYWQWGSAANNTFEAIKLSWQVAGTSGTPSGNFSYTLFGRPNSFYAMRVASIDHREQLLMPTRSDKIAFVYGGNYLRVFAPTIKQTTKKTCASGCATAVTSDPPTLNVDLASDTPVPTRVWSQDSVSSRTDGWINDDQALFPELSYLKLFTPQMDANGASGASYPSSYVLSDSDTGLASRLLAPFPGPPNPQNPKMLLAPQLLVMPQPMNLPSGDADFSLLSQNTYQLNWLRPTTENPCPMQVQLQPPNEGNWPTNPSSCPDSTRNAWDDYLDASVTYEARSIASDSTNAQGFITDQLLRCANPDASGNCDRARATFTLTNFSGTNYSNDSQRVQQAQGYAHVEAPATSTNDTGALGVWTETNRPDLITNMKLWPRFQPEAAAYDGAARTNTVTGNPSMWFCKPGLPAGARIAEGSFGASNDRTVQTSETNDKSCDGYTVGWRWDQTSSDANVQDACSTTSQTPLPTAFAAPSLGALPGDQRAEALSWGDYSSYGSTQRFPGNPTTWRTRLRENGTATVPYDGSRPGRGSGYAQQACSKGYGDGRLNGGTWQRSGNHTVISRKDVQVQVTVQVPKQVQVKQTVCKSWNKARTKCLKSVVETVTKTVMVPEQKTVTKTIEVKTIYPAFDWSFGSTCFPSNAQELKNTPGLSRFITLEDQRSSYTTQTDALPANAWLNNFDALKSDGAGPQWALDSGFGSCAKSYPGWVQSGQWNIARPAEPGFGENQTGPRLDSGNYLAQFSFGGLTPSALAAGVTWRMAASYDGFTGWKWKSQQRKASLSDDPSDPGPSVVRVYGTRGTR
jgi:hypothetical protein